jgi:hypothetical protein
MGEASKEGRRRSIDGSSPAPAVPKLRRSGTLPVFPKDEQVTPTRESIPVGTQGTIVMLGVEADE